MQQHLELPVYMFRSYLLSANYAGTGQALGAGVTVVNCTVKAPVLMGEADKTQM